MLVDGPALVRLRRRATIQTAALAALLLSRDGLHYTDSQRYQRALNSTERRIRRAEQGHTDLLFLKMLVAALAERIMPPDPSIDFRRFILVGADARGRSREAQAKLFNFARHMAGLPRRSRVGPQTAKPRGRPRESDAIAWPRDAAGLMVRGERHFAAGEFDLACEAFSAALTRAPNEARATIGLAKSLVCMTQTDLGANCERAIKLLNGVLARCARDRSAAGENSSAQTTLTRGTALHWLGRALLERPERGMRDASVEAIPVLRQALRLRPRRAVPLQWAETADRLAIALAHRPERQRVLLALRYINEVERIYRRSGMAQEWAELLKHRGNWFFVLESKDARLRRRELRNAIRAYRRALVIRPPEKARGETVSIQYNLGTSLVALAKLSPPRAANRLWREAEHHLLAAVNAVTLANQKAYAYAYYNYAEYLTEKPAATERELWHAVACLGETLRVYTKDVALHEWRGTHVLLARVLDALAGKAHSRDAWLFRMAMLSQQAAEGD